MVAPRELKRLRDEGWEYGEIAKVACKTEKYIRAQGEERLIQSVESGIFPIKFAIQVASTDDSQIQAVLMDAFADGPVTTTNFGQARRIILARAKQSKKSPATGPKGSWPFAGRSGVGCACETHH